MQPSLSSLNTDSPIRICKHLTLTVYGSQDDPGVVVGYDVSVAVFGLVDFQVGMLPGELLTGVNGLRRNNKHTCISSVCWQTFEGNGKRVLCNVDKLQQ